MDRSIDLFGILADLGNFPRGGVQGGEALRGMHSGRSQRFGFFPSEALSIEQAGAINRTGGAGRKKGQQPYILFRKLSAPTPGQGVLGARLCPGCRQ